MTTTIVCTTETHEFTVKEWAGKFYARFQPYKPGTKTPWQAKRNIALVDTFEAARHACIEKADGFRR